MNVLGIVILLENFKGVTDVGGGPNRILLLLYINIIYNFNNFNNLYNLFNNIHLNAINTI